MAPEPQKHTWKGAPSSKEDAIKVALNSDIYARLGYVHGDSLKDLQSRYRHMARLLHADLNGDATAMTSEKIYLAMANVNEAHSLLEDPKKLAAWMEKQARRNGQFNSGRHKNSGSNPSQNHNGFEGFSGKELTPLEKFEALVSSGHLAQATRYGLDGNLAPQLLAQRLRSSACDVLRSKDSTKVHDLLSIDPKVLSIVARYHDVKNEASIRVCTYLSKGHISFAERLIDTFSPFNSLQTAAQCEKFANHIGLILESPLPFTNSATRMAGALGKYLPQQALAFGEKLGLSPFDALLHSRVSDFIAAELRRTAPEVFGGQYPVISKPDDTITCIKKEPLKNPDFKTAREKLLAFAHSFPPSDDHLLCIAAHKAILQAATPPYQDVVIKLLLGLGFSPDTSVHEAAMSAVAKTKKDLTPKEDKPASASERGFLSALRGWFGR